MLELYEQNRVPPSQISEAEGNQRPPSKGPSIEERSSHSGSTSKGLSLKPAPSRQGPDEQNQNADNHIGPPKITQMRNKDYVSSENNSIRDREDNINDSKEVVDRQGNSGEIQNKWAEGDQEGNSGRIDAVEVKDKLHSRSVSNKDVAVGQSPQDATKKLDKEKLKAAFERRKARGDITRKVDPMDELERELEDVEVPGDSEKTKREKNQSWSKPSRTDHENSHRDFDIVEEGEVEASDDFERGHRSPKSNRGRKPGSPLDRNRLGRLG